jgi:hypothetical protein
MYVCKLETFFFHEVKELQAPYIMYVCKLETFFFHEVKELQAPTLCMFAS